MSGCAYQHLLIQVYFDGCICYKLLRVFTYLTKNYIDPNHHDSRSLTIGPDDRRSADGQHFGLIKSLDNLAHTLLNL
jgi:hypothetical protein